MFVNCIEFNQPLNIWDTSNVKNMNFMFKGCFEFDGDWYPAESGIWTDESDKNYQSQIDLKELEHFDVDLSILKETQVYKTKL